MQFHLDLLVEVVKVLGEVCLEKKVQKEWDMLAVE